MLMVLCHPIHLHIPILHHLITLDSSHLPPAHQQSILRRPLPPRIVLRSARARVAPPLLIHPPSVPHPPSAPCPVHTLLLLRPLLPRTPETAKDNRPSPMRLPLSLHPASILEGQHHRPPLFPLLSPKCNLLSP